MTNPASPVRHVSDTYSDSYFCGGIGGYPNYIDSRQILIEHGWRYGRILKRYINQPGKVLDVGSAAGFILKGLVDSGWEGYGIEPNNKIASYARDNLGLQIETGTIESFKSNIRYDLICLIQVIGHLIDPKEAFSSVCNTISNGGYILVETWNWKSWTAKIFGRYWHEYNPPSVLHWFSPRSLNRLMSQMDFQLISTGHLLKRILWKHAKSIIQNRLNNLPILNNLLTLIPDSTVIPYPSEDLFWSLFRYR